MRLDVYIHTAASQTDAKLDTLISQGALLMAAVTDLKTLAADLDVETNAVAAKIDAEMAQIADLKAQIAAGSPVSQADLDSIVASLGPVSDRLKALGADPAQPIPTL